MGFNVNIPNEYRFTYQDYEKLQKQAEEISNKASLPYFSVLTMLMFELGWQQHIKFLEDTKKVAKHEDTF